MSVDKTDFGSVPYIHANFWPGKRLSVFLCFSLINQRYTSCITVYNRTDSNIENTVRAVHSCNSWFITITQIIYLDIGVTFMKISMISFIIIFALIEEMHLR